MITPGAIYADLGSKRLRELLLFEGKVDSLFGLTNERYIFEGVHHAQKTCILVFEKSGSTESFRAAFRINTREAIAPDKLDEFLNSASFHLRITTDLVRRLSPDSLSIMEFKNELDIRIAEKTLRFPLLGEKVQMAWDIRLTSEFHMTGDSDLYQTKRLSSTLPLFEGKMINQFTVEFGQPRYWVSKKEGRKRILGNVADSRQSIESEFYRLCFRSVASNTNERTLISAILPPCFFGHSISAVRVLDKNGNRVIPDAVQAYLCAVWNSFAFDYLIRAKVASNLSFFYIYQLPVPRLTEKDPAFKPIVDRAAKLICTTPEFDDLARQLGLESHNHGATDAAERARLRAELDGIIANLYGLTEEEFAYILTTFPVVPQAVKDAALAAYREYAPKTVDQQVAALIAAGESATVEFKSSVRWDMKENRPNDPLKFSTIKTVAAFLNTNGGTLLIGVDDGRNVVGLRGDYALFNKPDSRDAFENYLTTQLLDHFGNAGARYFSMDFHEINGQDICRIVAEPSPNPVFVTDKTEQLYIRTGNSTRALSSREAIEYSRQRWPNI